MTCPKQSGVHATDEFLERFFENLLLGAKHELKNRHLHVDYEKITGIQSATDEAPKCKNCTFEELAILRAVAAEPTITQRKLAVVVGKPERTIRSRTIALQEKEYLRHENGKRNGRWELSDAAKSIV